MLNLHNKTVLITGASSGIGAACAKHFAANKARLILTARRIDKLKQLTAELTNQYQIEVLPIQLDVRDKHQVNNSINNLEEPWKNIDILINNAGLALDTVKIQYGNPEHWDTMIKTNICGLLYVTHAVLPIMLSRSQGHIINIGSIGGHECCAAGNVYSATKHAVRALSKSMRIDLLGTAIRVSEIDPGLTHTEFSEVRWNSKERSDQFYAQFTPLTGDDIAEGVVYCATRPLHVNIAEMIICPTTQAAPDKIYKKGQKESWNVFD